MSFRNELVQACNRLIKKIAAGDPHLDVRDSLINKLKEIQNVSEEIVDEI